MKDLKVSKKFETSKCVIRPDSLVLFLIQVNYTLWRDERGLHRNRARMRVVIHVPSYKFFSSVLRGGYNVNCITGMSGMARPQYFRSARTEEDKGKGLDKIMVIKGSQDP